MNHEAFSRADEFAAHVGESVRPWMLWEGWSGWIGCDLCAEDGPATWCWGREGCHGYYRGCGCAGCIEKDREDCGVQ